MPLTIYKLLELGLDIYNIGNILGNGHEKYNIKEDDYVIFSYGWSDIQKNIYVYSKNTYEIDIKNMIEKYLLLLQNYKTKYKITPIVYNILPNPLKKSENINGSDEERSCYTIYFNSILEEMCKKIQLPYLNIYSLISDKNGYIKKECTKDGIHLDYNNSFLRKEIDKIIIKFIKNIQ